MRPGSSSIRWSTWRRGRRTRHAPGGAGARRRGGSRFAAAGAQLDTLQLAVHEDLKAQVAEVNQLAQSVAELNQRIAAVLGLGHTPNDLLDQRDQAIAKLTREAAGQHGAGRRRLARRVHRRRPAPGAGHAGAAADGGGRPERCHRARRSACRTAASCACCRTTSSAAAASPGCCASRTTTWWTRARSSARWPRRWPAAVNQQQALGLDLRDPPGSGAPIFAVGAPLAVPNANNAVNGAGSFIGQVSLSVTDATQLQASEYELRADPAARRACGS